MARRDGRDPAPAPGGAVSAGDAHDPYEPDPDAAEWRELARQFGEPEARRLLRDLD